MIFSDKIESKILSLPDLLKRIEFWRRLGDKILFTNGCFDILHKGHIYLLSQCSQMEARIVIGLNSDASVKRLKGSARPVNDENSRAILLAATQFTDAITLFQTDTPEDLIQAVKPDILVKGGDWKKEQIAGSKFVSSYGGSVKTIPYMEGYSTTGIIERSKS